MQKTQPEQARGNDMKKPLVLKRTINAPREKVWAAWTEPERIKAWWGPRGFTAPVAQIDLRESGKYLFSMRSPEGQEFWSTGTYLEIDRPSRLVMTDSFSDEKGNIVNASYYSMNPDFPLKSTVTLTLAESGPATDLTLHYDDVSTIAAEDLQNMKEGWQETIDKLAEYVEAAGAGSEEADCMCDASGDTVQVKETDRDCDELDDAGRAPRCEL